MRLILALVVMATPALAQMAAPRSCVTCAQLSDSAFFAARDARGALAIALEGLARDSNNVALLWRAARAETALGIVYDGSVARDGHLARAIAFARRAVARAPNDAEAHFWLAAPLGRLALRVGFRASASLASEAYREASRVLALDSTHAGGHDVIGKLNSEVRKLPWVIRILAATLTRLEVARTASWEAAERHLKRSIMLDPTLMIARADLAELYLRMGRRPDAAAVVAELERMPRRTPVDEYLQAEARRLLGSHP